MTVLREKNIGMQKTTLDLDIKLAQQLHFLHTQKISLIKNVLKEHIRTTKSHYKRHRFIKSGQTIDLCNQTHLRLWSKIHLTDRFEWN